MEDKQLCTHTHTHVHVRVAITRHILFVLFGVMCRGTNPCALIRALVRTEEESKRLLVWILQ
ncbi:hypothetical protein WH47_03500 [Habropoda laboriosa]|uniref:Uncharacterized protein n=1 Tax=Habropoda laboriosa TaxID=597456 RepID=A0A0L7RBP9_9HYME|nr:hypothetical protein WH47_03500 [Habropoda laboriosa]